MMPDGQSTEVYIDDKQTRIEALGRVVSSQNQAHFERMIRSMHWSGVVDITDWTFEAIRVLVKICSEEKLIITFKQGTRYFMPVHYPIGALLDSFAKIIMTGCF
ncbi:MAG: hypothetical protein ACFFCT_10840 [Candidatus Odinarchaeota archaeon]